MRNHIILDPRKPFRVKCDTCRRLMVYVRGKYWCMCGRNVTAAQVELMAGVREMDRILKIERGD